MSRNVRGRLTGTTVFAVTIGLALCASGAALYAAFVGSGAPAGFSLCEQALDGSGGPRLECQASDIRFQMPGGTGSRFGFSLASGFLNGDDLVDLVVGDPARNRVYVFYGRAAVGPPYGLLSSSLDRGVSPETAADLVLFRDPAIPNQVGSLGFSVAVSRRQTAAGCGPDGKAAALLIGAPGQPGTAANAPGTVFHLPPGSLCQSLGASPTAQVLDPGVIGQAFISPDPEQNDSFGYSVAFGRLLGNTGTQDDVIVGATGALAGAGRVTAFPVTANVVDLTDDQLVKIQGQAGDALGEVLASGDLDLDFNAGTNPHGDLDDLAIGAVGRGGGRALLLQGPLSPAGGSGMNGVFMEGDTQVRPILGEADGDFFGFSAAIDSGGRLAVGAVFADNVPPDSEGTGGGDPLTNVRTGPRVNAGKVYVWDPGFLQPGPALKAKTADLVLVARRSGDQLGFAVGFGDLDGNGLDDVIVTARREDGSGLKVNEIDQGTAYVILDATTPTSPVDLGLCAANSDCTGVAGVDVLIFGGDRRDNKGDEIGYALATGNFNGDTSDDLFLSSITQQRVYVVTLEDSDDDRATRGRNIRDDDDDGDGDPDSTDCDPLDAAIFGGAKEITCNSIDENCNGMTDDAPDKDGDGYDACGRSGPTDCDDNDANSRPGAPEVCDGNDNDCSAGVPSNERDLDGDRYVACAGWSDTQGDQPTILGGGDCSGSNADIYPGAAPRDNPTACMRDRDKDGYGDYLPPTGVTAGSDCDDQNIATFPGAAPNDDAAACMKDVDGDDFGDAASAAPVARGTDCADGDARSYPGAPEQCDGNDNACTGTIADAEKDGDGDRYVACAGWNDTQGDNATIRGGGDCAPADIKTFPGAAPRETNPAACMTDKDGDDYGDQTPAAGITPGTDCDDDSAAAAATFPGAAPRDAPLNCMKDSDGDDYGDISVALPVVPGTDCGDNDVGRFPGAAETPDDGIDQDCSGADTVTCYVDADQDGYGSTTSQLDTDGDCTDPGQAPNDTDCDDADALISPGTAEVVGDGIDQDCNGSDAISCFVDADHDGFGSTVATTTPAADGTCDAAQGESASATDCNDADPNTHPGATQRCDGNDNTCSGAVPANEMDADGDRYVACTGWNDTQGDNPTILGGGDCGPTDAFSFPGAAPNETFAAGCMRDRDGDDYGDLNPPAGVTPGTDCDDSAVSGATTYPGAAANDGPLNCMKDADGDDYGDAGVALPVVRGTDCADNDATTHPGATQLCDGNDNTCGGSVPAAEIDADGDGYVACSGWSDTQGDNPAVVGGNDCAPAAADTFPGAAAREIFAAACMKDSDGDDFGDVAPPAGVTRGTDCDDNSPTAADTYPGAAAIDGPLNCMKDSDDDDYGDAGASLPVVRGTDCDDNEALAHPGALEGPPGDATCGDLIDNDCDALVDAADPGCQMVAVCPDADLDGFADCTSDPLCDATGLTCGDCDDAAGAINPSAVEACDAVDNDCNGMADEGFDLDGDGYTTCQSPVADCDDTNPLVNPGAAEQCSDGIDNDCSAATPDLFDADGDGATCDLDCDDGSAALNLLDADGDGYSTCAGDCDDANPAVNPGAAEVCADGLDNDCNPATPDSADFDGDGAACGVDCDDTDPALNLLDADGDGFTSCGGDCNDADPAVHPTATESCDGVDNDCDGIVDNGYDLDGDGYSTCQSPDPDCNDADPAINPGAAELCNDGIDNDCNPVTADVGDLDGDGVACTLDCDDADPNSYPGAAERCDGNDNACSGSVPANEIDADGDGHVACSGWSDTQGDDPTIVGGDDCDDSDPATFPGAGFNEAFATACMTDLDGDGYGDLTPATTGVTRGTDCDDASPVTFFGAAQIEGPLNCMKDADDDGYGDAGVSLPVDPGSDCDDNDAARNPGAVDVCGDGIDNDCDGVVDQTCALTVPQLALTGGATVTWGSGSGVGTSYCLYRGSLDRLRGSGEYTQEPGIVPDAARFCGLAQSTLTDDFVPAAGGVVFYLVTARVDGIESDLGSDSTGRLRRSDHPCPW